MDRESLRPDAHLVPILPLRDTYFLLLSAFLLQIQGSYTPLAWRLETLLGLCREYPGGAIRRAEKGVEDQHGRLVCRWGLLGVGWARGSEAPVFVHCAQELLYIGGQQVVHLVTLDRMGWGQRRVLGHMVELKDRRKVGSPCRASLLLALVGPEFHPLLRMA